MQIKFNLMSLFVVLGLVGVFPAMADDEFEFYETDIVQQDSAANPEDVSADAIEDYQVEGSLFQQITDLEQEKILMQLEKERAQLNLDLDRLAAEKIKLHMEIDTLSGRAEQQQAEIQTEMARLETEAKKLEREREALLSNPSEEIPYMGAVVSAATRATITPREEVVKAPTDIEKQYKLVNVFGAGSQLQATVQDLSNGQNKKLTVGKELDGFRVKSISLDEGVVFVNGDDVQTLNIGSKSL